MLIATRTPRAPLGNLTNLSNQAHSWNCSSAPVALVASPTAGPPGSGMNENTCSRSPGSIGPKTGQLSDASFRRRRPSKNYGDLFNLRPRSPPPHSTLSQHKGLQLSPGKYIDDTPLCFCSDVDTMVQSNALQTAYAAGLASANSTADLPVPPVRTRLCCR